MEKLEAEIGRLFIKDAVLKAELQQNTQLLQTKLNERAKLEKEQSNGGNNKGEPDKNTDKS